MTGPVSLSVMQPCSIRFRDLQVIMNLLPSFSSNGRTGTPSDKECSVRGLLKTCSWINTFTLWKKMGSCEHRRKLLRIKQVRILKKQHKSEKEKKILQVCRDQEKTDSIGLLFWQNVFHHLSLKYTAKRWTVEKHQSVWEYYTSKSEMLQQKTWW